MDPFVTEAHYIVPTKDPVLHASEGQRCWDANGLGSLSFDKLQVAPSPNVVSMGRLMFIALTITS